MSDEAVPNWVRVEFHGLTPADWQPGNVDIPAAANQLMRAFGFTHLDGLTIETSNDQITLIPHQVPWLDGDGGDDAGR
jgi:hypothetical protein